MKQLKKFWYALLCIGELGFDLAQILGLCFLLIMIICFSILVCILPTITAILIAVELIKNGVVQ